MPNDQDPFSPPSPAPPLFPGRAPGTQVPPTPPDPPDACSPGSCGAQISQQARNNGDQLQRLQTLLQGIDLGLLAVINAKLDTVNAKLGPQVPGGLSGFLKRFWNSLNLGRILNVLTFIATLHNAYMLSNMLSQTLFSAFDNVLAIFNRELKDADDDEIDTSQWVGQQIENFFNGIFGTERVDNIQATWKKWNRIYQAASNLMFSIQSIGHSILGALEVVGTYNAWVGNALKRFGVVAENAYRWMNPNVNFQNRYFTALQNAQEMADSLEEITGNVRDITETVSEMQEQKEELDKAIEEGTRPTETPENKQQAQQQTTDRQASATPTITPADQNRPSTE